MKNFHYMHMVSMSPWPLLNSMNIFNLMMCLIVMMHNHNHLPLIMAILLMTLSSFTWWRDVFRESNYENMYNKKIKSGLKLGMILFIISEVLFFFSFFWAFFQVSLSANIEVGGQWPPTSMLALNPMHTPLLNTILLLSSGASITWSHFMILNNNKKMSHMLLTITILLGWTFTFLQFMEYCYYPYNFSDSAFSSTFYMATGFHGMHVILGSIFLLQNLMQIKTSFSKEHHLSFELAAWYWHFVDIVWLFLYCVIYWYNFYL